MRLTIDTSQLQQLASDLAGFSDRRLRAGLATALTRTARLVDAEWTGQLSTKFDRPTPLTLKATVVQTAQADKLQAVVMLRDQSRDRGIAPAEYLAPQEEGGQRGLKKFERALQSQGSMPSGWRVVPGKYAQLDGFGNISRGQIVQVLAQLGSAYSPGYQRVISTSAAKRAASAVRRGREYVAIVKRAKVGSLAPGVYQRSGKALLPVFIYTPRATYTKRLSLMADGLRVAQAQIGPQIKMAIDQQFENLARKQGRAP